MVRPRKATKSLRSPEHRALCAALVAAREKAGLTQTDLAKRLGKPQSYVSKYESGERRLDVVEFVRVVEAIGASAARIIKSLAG